MTRAGGLSNGQAQWLYTATASPGCSSEVYEGRIQGLGWIYNTAKVEKYLIQLIVIASAFAAYWFIVRENSAIDIRSWPRFAHMLPGFTSVAIFVSYFLTESGAVEFFRTEYMLGIFLVFLLPLACLLLVLQIAIWIRNASNRKRQTPGI